MNKAIPISRIKEMLNKILSSKEKEEFSDYIKSKQLDEAHIGELGKSIITIFKYFRKGNFQNLRLTQALEIIEGMQKLGIGKERHRRFFLRIRHILNKLIDLKPTPVNALAILELEKISRINRGLIIRRIKILHDGAKEIEPTLGQIIAIIKENPNLQTKRQIGLLCSRVRSTRTRSVFGFKE